MKNRIMYIWRALLARERPMVNTDHITWNGFQPLEMSKDCGKRTSAAGIQYRGGSLVSAMLDGICPITYPTVQVIVI